MKVMTWSVVPRRFWLVAVCITSVAAVLALGSPTLFGAVRNFFPASSQSLREGDDFRGVVNVYCTPRGFDDEELSLPSGRYVVAIRNASGLEDLSFSITGREESPLASGTARAGSSLDATMTFTEGTYTITEASHPEWQLEIQVAK